ncbi:hypothetical protein [Mumia flava]|uniref:hypothetical protein n=1 Tax=Mumia flava TaxID=1348852 RepID=UPI001B807337|nr:hypothetical protein [Mumia flava]
MPASHAIASLARACATEHHEFWANDRSLLDGAFIESTRIHGPRQVTDLYLLAAAVARGGRLATFDRSIPLSAVPGATDEHLVQV